MAKKGGKKGKGNRKGGGGGAAKKGTSVQNTISPGHQVEDRILNGEGEGDTATKDAPEAAAASISAAVAGTTASTSVPSAAPESAAPPGEQEETETSQAEKEEEPAAQKKVASAESAPVAEESTTAPVEKDVSKKTEDVSKQGGTEQPESAQSKEALPLASATAAGAVGAATGIALAERPKSQDNKESTTSTAEAHAKRPYETSLLIQDETKPHKVLKVDESDDVSAPAKANSVLQGGKNPDLHIPGTPSVSEPRAAAASALPAGNAVEPRETSKDLETQESPIAAAAAAGAAAGAVAAVAAVTAAVHNGTKEPESEAEKVTEPAAAIEAQAPALIKTKDFEAELQKVTAPTLTITEEHVSEHVSDYSTTTTVPVETKVIESELKKVTERPAAAVTKEQVPGSAANGKLSTPIPSLAVNQPESIGKVAEDRSLALSSSPVTPPAGEDRSVTLASSSAAPAGPAVAGTVLHPAEGTFTDKVDLGSQAVGREDVKRAEAELQAKASERATAQEASADGGKAGNLAPAVDQLQSTIDEAKEKSAELERKTEEYERRRGGFFGWLRRKIKGEK